MSKKNNSYRIDVVPHGLHEYTITVYSKEDESDFRRFNLVTPQSLYNVQEFMYSLTDANCKAYFT